MKIRFLRLSFAALAIFNLAAVPLFSQTRETAQATSVITGRVTIGEKPAAGVIVGVMRSQINSPNDAGALAKTATDADGRYRLAGVPAGSFRISPLERVRKLKAIGDDAASQAKKGVTALLALFPISY